MKLTADVLRTSRKVQSIQTLLLLLLLMMLLLIFWVCNGEGWTKLQLLLLKKLNNRLHQLNKYVSLKIFNINIVIDILWDNFNVDTDLDILGVCRRKINYFLCLVFIHIKKSILYRVCQKFQKFTKSNCDNFKNEEPILATTQNGSKILLMGGSKNWLKSKTKIMTITYLSLSKCLITPGPCVISRNSLLWRQFFVKIDSIIWSMYFCHVSKTVYLIWARKLSRHCGKVMSSKVCRQIS